MLQLEVAILLGEILNLKLVEQISTERVEACPYLLHLLASVVMCFCAQVKQMLLLGTCSSVLVPHKAKQAQLCPLLLDLL